MGKVASGALRFAQRALPYVRRGIKLYNRYKGMSQSKQSMKTRSVVGSVNATGHFKKVVWKARRQTRKRRRFKKFRGKVMKSINDMADKSHYIRQGTIRIDSEPSRCAIGEFSFLDNITLLEARRKTIFNQSTTQNYDLNKLRVINTHIEIFMVNPTNACIYVDQYEIKRKGKGAIDQTETPRTWLQSFIETTDITRNNAQPVANSVLTANNQYAVGFDLFQVPAFFQKWKIVKKTRTLLQPGECVTRTVKRHPDWIWDPKQHSLATATSAVNVINGVVQMGQLAKNNKKTVHLLFKIFGQVTNNNADKSIVGFTPAALNIAWTEDITIAQVADYAPNGVARGNIWVESQFPAIVAPQFIQEYNAPVVAYAEA